MVVHGFDLNVRLEDDDNADFDLNVPLEDDDNGNVLQCMIPCLTLLFPSSSSFLVFLTGIGGNICLEAPVLEEEEEALVLEDDDNNIGNNGVDMDKDDDSVSVDEDDDGVGEPEDDDSVDELEQDDNVDGKASVFCKQTSTSYSSVCILRKRHSTNGH
jgi:hypothetical protein